MTGTARPFGTVGFGHHSEEFASDTCETLRERRARAAVGRSDYRGGFRVVTSCDEVMTALRRRG